MRTIIGIDLGTSTSEVAVFKDGKLYIIPNHLGSYITPSVVGVSEEGRIIAGSEAEDQLLLRPEDTVMEVKRVMGTNTKIKMGGREYTPQEISSHLLRYLIECAEKHLGEKIDRAVITVPAYFSDTQRKAVVEAGQLAGVKVERIINEPTAASLDYGIDHMTDCKNILVYDFGGGTLDVTVLELFEGIIDVKASSGNNRLGGKDFDNSLMDYCLENFRKKHGAGITTDNRAMMRLKRECEKCKVALSKEQEYSIVLPFFAEAGGDPVSLEETIDRELFDGLIKADVDSTGVQIHSALKDAGLLASDIDLTLLVGGSTRVPYVREFVAKEMGKAPGMFIDAELAVVRGAGIQAGIINEAISSEDGILITDVCPYTLGISVLEFFGGIPDDDVFDIIIPRNTTIPVTKEKVYETVHIDQPGVEVKIYQGESRKASSNNFLGKYIFDGIPKGKTENQKIRVAFSYDTNGILVVESTIISTGKKAALTVETAGVSMVEEIDLSAWKDMPGARKYRAVINKAEKILNNNDAGIFEPEMDDLIFKLKRGLLTGEDKDTLEQYKEELHEILYDLEDNDGDI